MLDRGPRTIPDLDERSIGLAVMHVIAKRLKLHKVGTMNAVEVQASVLRVIERAVSLVDAYLVDETTKQSPIGDRAPLVSSS